MYSAPSRIRASSARANGRAAISEAIQHHMDHLGPNKTRSVFSGTGVFSPSMSAAPRGEMARAHAANVANPNTTFFTPKQSRVADSMARQNNPLGRLGSKIENFLQLKQIAQQGAHIFDPRSKAGLANIAGMFVGGPKGDASEMMGKLGMPGQFRDYNSAPVDPLQRGITHETMGQNIRIGRRTEMNLKDFPKGSQELLMRSLAERAQGVGRYNRPGQSPLDVLKGIEQQRAAQSRDLVASDELKNTKNMMGAYAKKSTERYNTHNALNKQMGTDLGPAWEPSPVNEGQSADYTDRMTLLNLQKRMPGNEMLGTPDYLLQSIHDMLFGGKGMLRKPARPGNSNPSGSPYGGGPFG